MPSRWTAGVTRYCTPHGAAYLNAPAACSGTDRHGAENLAGEARTKGGGSHSTEAPSEPWGWVGVQKGASDPLRLMPCAGLYRLAPVAREALHDVNAQPLCGDNSAPRSVNVLLVQSAVFGLVGLAERSSHDFKALRWWANQDKPGHWILSILLHAR